MPVLIESDAPPSFKFEKEDVSVKPLGQPTLEALQSFGQRLILTPSFTGWLESEGKLNSPGQFAVRLWRKKDGPDSVQAVHNRLELAGTTPLTAGQILSALVQFIRQMTSGRIPVETYLLYAGEYNGDCQFVHLASVGGGPASKMRIVMKPCNHRCRWTRRTVMVTGKTAKK